MNLLIAEKPSVAVKVYRELLEKSENENKPIKRLWVNSFTMKDLLKGWNELKPSSEYDNLYKAALSRTTGDWLVGLNATRAYSLATGVQGLSVGRVQTPTLSLIVKRDEEVENWQPKFYYQLIGTWKDVELVYENEGETKFKTEEELKVVKSKVLQQQGRLTNLSIIEKTNNPSKPFDLTQLQIAANNKYGIIAADTLKLTQELYEKKLVTYPRTDSEYLPETMLDEAYTILLQLCEKDKHQYLKDKTNKLSFFNSKKVTDHFAIIPTGETTESLTGELEKVYSLIKNRFIEAFGLPFIIENTTIKVKCNEIQFKGSFNVSKDLGFKNIFNDKEEDEEELISVKFIENEEHLFTEVEAVKKEVTKPKYFTEATILTAMEMAGKYIEEEELKEAMKERGLGTPATRANILETLKKRNYVTTNKKALISTTKGRELIKLVDPMVSLPELTGNWEYKLNQMSKGNYDGRVFFNEIYTLINSIVSKADEKGVAFKEVVEKDLPTCPKCATRKLTKNKNGYFCNDECGFKLFNKKAKRTLSDVHLLNLINSKKTKTIKGFKNKDGKKFDAQLTFNKDFQVIYNFKETNNDTSIKVLCPKCNNKTVQIKPSGAFCNTEGCQFKIFRLMASKKLTNKILYTLLEKGITEPLNGFKTSKGFPFKNKTKIVLKDDKSGVQFKFS